MCLRWALRWPHRRYPNFHSQSTRIRTLTSDFSLATCDYFFLSAFLFGISHISTNNVLSFPWQICAESVAVEWLQVWCPYVHVNRKYHALCCLLSSGICTTVVCPVYTLHSRCRWTACSSYQSGLTRLVRFAFTSCRYSIAHNWSTTQRGVFERRKSTGSETFSVIICLNWRLIETICPKFWAKPLLKN